MNFATPKTEQEFSRSGHSGFYSKPHDAWFFDGETPPPIEAKPKPLAKPKPEPKTDPAPTQEPK